MTENENRLTIAMEGFFIRRIVIDMQSSLFADTVASVLEDFDTDLSVYRSESPEKTLDLCIDTQANILIMEVTDYTPWIFEERMKIRERTVEQLPDCKIVLVVNEKTNHKSADKVRLAKKNGVIDFFIYSSVSATYMSAVIDTLQSA